MKGYRKDDVEFHSDMAFSRPGHAAINVKVYRWSCVEDVVERFDCDPKQAEKALEYAWETQQEFFWEDEMPFLAEEFDYEPSQFHSEGRSNGWLVSNYDHDDVASWDAIELDRWVRFEKRIKEAVKYLSSDDSVLGLIEMNEWHKEAERSCCR